MSTNPRKNKAKKNKINAKALAKIKALEKADERAQIEASKFREIVWDLWDMDNNPIRKGKERPTKF